MKTLPKIPVLLIVANTICSFIRADLAEAIEAIRINKDPEFRLETWEGFDLTDAQIVGQNLRFNTTIEHLDLSKNDINGECAFAIANTLKDNTTITYLDLSNNCITGECASAIMNTLKNNTTITYLDLSDNLIDTISYEFKPGTEKNKTLKTIVLSDNLLNNDCARSIAEIILANEALEEIYIGGNSFGEIKLHEITYVVSNQPRKSWWMYDKTEQKLLLANSEESKIAAQKAHAELIAYKKRKEAEKRSHRIGKNSDGKQTKGPKWRKKKTLAEPFSVSEEEKTESDSSSTSEEEKMGSDSSFTEDEGQY